MSSELFVIALANSKQASRRCTHVHSSASHKIVSMRIMVLTYVIYTFFSIASNRGCLTRFARSPIKINVTYIINKNQRECVIPCPLAVETRLSPTSSLLPFREPGHEASRKLAVCASCTCTYLVMHLHGTYTVCLAVNV